LLSQNINRNLKNSTLGIDQKKSIIEHTTNKKGRNLFINQERCLLKKHDAYIFN